MPTEQNNGPASTANVSLRKRQQIENTGKTMFTWVAIASAIVAIAMVLSSSIVERLVFNQRILAKKGETAANLKSNNEVVERLRASIRERNTSQALLDTKKLDQAEPLSVVLDALPAQPNTEALGASLKQKLLNVPGVRIESLNPGEISDEEGTSTSGTSEIEFSFKVSASSTNSIIEVLRNLERSIRVFSPQQVVVEQQSGAITLTVTGVAYYAPEVKVELKEESIRPSSSGSTTKKAGNK
ncbi:MAG TPA: hypothetical protein VGE13_01955 [Candidatus Saccharimonadales bacterium]